MKKKGLTLVELLAVIVITVIILGISTPALITELKNAKNNELASNKEMIIAAARSYVIDKDVTIPESISVTQLCDANYLLCPITNPVDKTIMSGYVNIDSSKNYTYSDTAAY